MTSVRFGDYAFNSQHKNGTDYIFDVIRKKFVPLSPEEWVRQHVLHYLLSNKFPAAKIAVEKTYELNGLAKRCDVVVYNADFVPVLIVECKQPKVKLDEKTLEQLQRYNQSLRAHYWWLTNGEQNFVFGLREGCWLNEFPSYESMCA